MYKTQDCWSDDSRQHDSGSESAPLLSSGSQRSSHSESVIFNDSETSDLDASPTDTVKYGSISATSFTSTNTVLPKRLPPLVQHTSLHISPPTNIQEKCYEIHNIDLILPNKPYEVENLPSLKKEYSGGFLPGIGSTQHNIHAPCKDVKPKQSSLVTIFSVWNTILGSSLLTMPWGIAMAGFFPGIILMLLMSGLCLYTAYLLLVVHKYNGGRDKTEVTELSRIFLNKWAEYIARIFSVTVLLGAIIAYWILMSNFLYNSVNFFYDNIAGTSKHSVENDSYSPEILCPKKDVYNSSIIITHEKTYDVLGPAWDLHKTVPTFLAILIFPLLNFNSVTFFTKFNSLGTASVMYLITFIIIKSASWGVNMDKSDWEVSWVLQSKFPALSGTLALSFFIHNIIISIMQNNRDQSKNGRDLTIAYILVTITYVTVGAVFFMCFPLSKLCIEDNLLNNFQTWDGLTVGARIVLFFQLVTVYPLLAYMLRIQLLSSLWKKATQKGWILLVNFVVVSICVLFATFLPHVGTIIRYTGALSGLVYVFTLPCLLYIAILRKQGKLTMWKLCFHLCIPVIGGSNLIAQFLITDH